MGNFIDIASTILTQSERRLEVSAQNLSNITTPGYKRRVSFSSLVSPGAAATPQSIGMDFSAGKPVDTANPYDLMITGSGLFCVRSADGMLYTREGQFHRGSDGKVVNTQGYALQTQDGGDLVLNGDPFQVLGDGTVLEDGQPIAKLAIVDVADRQALAYADGGLFSAPDSKVTKVDDPSIRQGVLEASNVSNGDEMVSMMETLRRAETGQRLAVVYDDLMGRALNTFGQV